VVTQQPAGLAEPTVRVIALADEEARRRGAAYLGSDHLLLGLLAEGTGRAAAVLGSLGVTLERAQAAVEARFGHEQPPGAASLGRTPRAERALTAAAEEATRLQSPLVETEHLLLALVRDELAVGGAAQVLRDLGVEPDQVRARLVGAP
jgi:ATP-dependent Clp protease ATP-binding subunit ClpC